MLRTVLISTLMAFLVSGTLLIVGMQIVVQRVDARLDALRIEMAAGGQGPLNSQLDDLESRLRRMERRDLLR